jgi:hypothetical protein
MKSPISNLRTRRVELARALKATFAGRGAIGVRELAELIPMSPRLAAAQRIRVVANTRRHLGEGIRHSSRVRASFARLRRA